MKRIFFAGLFCYSVAYSGLSFAGEIATAIKIYEDSIKENEDLMTWFIPFRSFAEPKITSSLYDCSSWKGCFDSSSVCCIKGMLFPVLYIVLPIIQISAEIAATATVRICASPYLCYLAYKNQQARDVISFLKEAENYLDHKKNGHDDAKRMYYLNSSFLKPAFEKFRTTAINSHTTASHFLDRIKTNIHANQYRFNGNLWSINDFIEAASTPKTHEFSFAAKNETDKNRGHVECTICKEKIVIAAFIPCGHYIACDECHEKLKENALNQTPTCPTCRDNMKLP